MLARILKPGSLAPALIGVGIALLALACTPAANVQRIDAVSPSHVPALAGAEVLVIGVGFQRDARISIGGAPVSNTIWVNDRLLSTRLPGGLPAGRYDVVVTDTHGHRLTKPAAVEVEAPVAAQPAVAPATSHTADPTAPKPDHPSAASPGLPFPGLGSLPHWIGGYAEQNRHLPRIVLPSPPREPQQRPSAPPSHKERF